MNLGASPYFRPFLTNFDEMFHGKSGDLYLLIVHEKSWEWCLFSNFDVLGWFWRENGRGYHAGAWTPGGLNQEVGSLGGTYGTPAVTIFSSQYE